MKTTISLLFFLCTTLFVFGQNSLEITITNIEDDKGQILISLYNPDDDFPYHPSRHYDVEKTAYFKDGTIIYTIKDIPAGKYAVALLDDTNKNQDMDYNFVGIPQEGYGFSNNAKPRMLNPPYFEDCTFQVDSAQNIEIKMKYW